MPKIKKTAITTLAEAGSLMDAHQSIFKKYTKRDIRKHLTFSPEDIARLSKIQKKVQSEAKVKIHYTDIVRGAIKICEGLTPEKILKAIDECNGSI